MALVATTMSRVFTMVKSPLDCPLGKAANKMGGGIVGFLSFPYPSQAYGWQMRTEVNSSAHQMITNPYTTKAWNIKDIILKP